MASRERKKGMSLIVKTITRLTVGLILLYGIYIVLHGHVSPGGGFAGGVVLASSYVLLLLAFGKDFVQKDLPLALDSKLDCIGALTFALIAIWPLIFGGTFFVNFLLEKLPGNALRLISAGTIPLSNIAIGLKVGASLFLVIFLLSAFSGAEADSGDQPAATAQDKE